MKKITKDTTLSELLGDSKVEKVLAKHRLPCLTCPFAASEMEHLKIGEVCKMYGISLVSLLKDLNEIYPVRKTISQSKNKENNPNSKKKYLSNGVYKK